MIKGSLRKKVAFIFLCTISLVTRTVEYQNYLTDFMKWYKTILPTYQELKDNPKIVVPTFITGFIAAFFTSTLYHYFFGQPKTLMKNTDNTPEQPNVTINSEKIENLYTLEKNFNNYSDLHICNYGYTHEGEHNETLKNNDDQCKTSIWASKKVDDENLQKENKFGKFDTLPNKFVLRGKPAQKNPATLGIFGYDEEKQLVIIGIDPSHQNHGLAKLIIYQGLQLLKRNNVKNVQIIGETEKNISLLKEFKFKQEENKSNTLALDLGILSHQQKYNVIPQEDLQKIIIKNKTNDTLYIKSNV